MASEWLRSTLLSTWLWFSDFLWCSNCSHFAWGCLAGRPIQGSHPIHSVVSLLQGFPRLTPEHILGTNIVMALLAPVGQWRKWCTKIRQWSLPGAIVVPVLNVSSRVFWLELDDKALLDSYTVLQEGILCDVFSQKCSAAWQGARGERLTVAIMLPGCQDADDWLNFMLSQKNLWPTFTTRGTLTEEVSEQVFSKEPRRLQAKHLWMEVKLRWRVLADRMYSKAPTQKSKEELDALLFDRAARRNHTNPYEEKPYRGPAIKEVQAWWRQCKEWMAHFKDKVRSWSSTSRAFWRHYLVRKQKLSRKWMHLWSIVQKGGRLERALINSSDVDWRLT